MASQKTRRTAAHSDAARGPGTQSGRIKDVGQKTSSIVRDAAALLDDEIASGIVAARQVQQRFQKERRIDPADFKSALQKFRLDAHEVLSQVSDQVAAMGSKESSDLTTRLLSNTHDVLDLTVEMVNISAEIADQLVVSRLKTPPSRRGNNRR